MSGFFVALLSPSFCSDAYLGDDSRRCFDDNSQSTDVEAFIGRPIERDESAYAKCKQKGSTGFIFFFDLYGWSNSSSGIFSFEVYFEVKANIAFLLDLAN